VTALHHIDRPGRPRLAVRFREGSGPAVLFLPGYRSDMEGSKALYLDGWAARTGRPLLRFDYTGCGASDG
jgi:pimeloyl-ACP methyl ester carboxylesterase